jgi:hypothetical protein
LQTRKAKNASFMLTWISIGNCTMRANLGTPGKEPYGGYGMWLTTISLDAVLFSSITERFQDILFEGSAWLI